MDSGSIPEQESKKFLEDASIPAWQKILNLDEKHFEKSKYAGDSQSGEGKFRLKDLALLREVAPGTYAAAAEEVKEYSEALFQTKGQIRKYRLGRKLGSIPAFDMALHPELAWDHKAQDKYFSQHPELKTREF